MQSGRVVEIGTRDDILRRPQSDYTRMLIASVPSLTAAAAHAQDRRRRAGHGAALARPMARRGLLFGRGRVVKAAESVDITVRRGETVGIVGEFGLGQDHRGALHRPADRADLGRHPHRRCRRGAPAREPSAPAPAPRADRVPGPISLAQSATHRRRLHHRGARSISAWPRRTPMNRARRLMALVGLAPDCARPLSASVLRRPAPAHRHRPRAGHGAAAADRRRAGLRARRVGAGAGA